MSRNGECRFSIPRVYFVLQSRYGDKEDRRVECIFVEWRVFIDDMLPPSFILSLSLPFFLGVSYRVDYVAPSATVNFGERRRSASREKDRLISAKIRKIFPRRQSRRETSAPYKAQQLRKFDVKIFSMSDTFSSFFRYHLISFSVEKYNFCRTIQFPGLS